MRKQPHHMTATGSEDRIDNLTSIDRGDDDSALTDRLAGEVIRLARLATAMHMVETADRLARCTAPARHPDRQEQRA